MKVLTIKQPYATLISEGIKEYEFRTWKTNYRGEFLIHAGKGVDKEFMKKYDNLKLEYPAGYIIAKVNLEDCIEVTDEFRKYLKEKDSKVYEHIITNKEWKGYAFKLTNVEKIDKIAAKGKLSFWQFEI